ncbi:MAG: hypothetical protein LBL19_00430 [Spirochaetaceae bacterium]|jgi:hypothetical protein|nr:hypothetical protein [Spirochaetaceae bacterium]
MRKLRMLTPDGWYEIRTAVNNRESLFGSRRARSLLGGVLAEAKKRFVFEIRGLRLTDTLLSFYIRPADGFDLPWILKWIKQTFAVRYNIRAGRTGHIWGDRYWSGILEGEPEAEPGTETGAGMGGVRPLSVEMAIITGFFLIFPHTLPPTPP